MDLKFSINSFAKNQKIFSFLKNKIWVILNWRYKEKTSFVFKGNGDLIISSRGKAEYSKWQYLGNNLIVIKKEYETLILKIEVKTKSVIILRTEENSEYIFFVDEMVFSTGVIDSYKVGQYLESRYLKAGGNHQQNYSINTIVETLVKKNQKKMHFYRKFNNFFLAFCIIIILLLIILLLSIKT